MALRSDAGAEKSKWHIGVDPLRAIDLIWMLRDIKAKRALLPPDPNHLWELIELGLVEMRDDAPALRQRRAKSSIKVSPSVS